MTQLSNAASAPAPAFPHGTDDRRTARVVALFYLGLALAGVVSFMLVRPTLFEAGDPGATLANLVDSPGIARVGIAAEMAVVVTQALAAVWFFRLFRAVDAFAAGAIAVFGLVNAVVILVSAGLLATALDVALEPVGDPGTAHLLHLASDHMWGVGALFFGLWLIPMGWCVLQTLAMPRALGWVLIIGGAGYFLSAFVRYLVPDAGALVDLAALPATVGEVWIIGYLLVRGTGRPARSHS